MLLAKLFENSGENNRGIKSIRNALVKYNFNVNGFMFQKCTLWNTVALNLWIMFDFNCGLEYCAQIPYLHDHEFEDD